MRRIACALCVLGTVAAALVLTNSSARAHFLLCDFVTGGGWVFTVPNFTGAKANFGLVARCRNGQFSGHVNFVDHSFNPPLHVRSTSITGYTAPFPGSNRRDICGTAMTNKFGPVNFHVAVIDFDNGSPGAGEPGGLDGFGISLSSGYLLSTRELGPEGETGGGGNIQLHKPVSEGDAAECEGAPDPGFYPES